MPKLPGWQRAAHYQPARAVGGDFYDFINLPDGRLGVVVGDVADKGVPAALVMATTRTILRGVSERVFSPGEVLERVNELLHPDIPANMFVTCLYVVLDPANGRLQFANAGHGLPYRRHSGGVEELRATGMPLGLMTGMRYEEHETSLRPGETVLFHSDGLVEAHNPDREMFSFDRLRTLVAGHPGGRSLIDFLLTELDEFTGPDWEQEDDVTLVTLQRNDQENVDLGPAEAERPERSPGDGDWRSLAEFTLPSERDNERQAVERVAEAVQDLGLQEARLQRLKTAVAEAAMNAMEHGNQYREELPVSIQVLASETTLSVRITDHGGGESIPEVVAPDLEAKLAGTQGPRGWGLFLIKNMVDDLRVTGDESHHTVELLMYLGGAQNGN